MQHALLQPAIGGLVPFSSVDWPDHLCAVIFIAGCPWRCLYCHNPHLQHRHSHYSWPQVLDFLKNRQGCLDGVVLSGGEPLSEPAIASMAEDIGALGYPIALHTGGIYPRRLAELLPHLAWAGLDIKGDADSYEHITQAARSYDPVHQSLTILLAANIPFECRTTWHPDWLSETALLDLAQALAAKGVREYAVQYYRAAPELPPQALLSPAALQQLQALFPRFSCR